MRAVLAVALLVASLGCGGGSRTANCPGTEDPRRMTDAELEAGGRRAVPERDAVTRETVNVAVHDRRAYLERNFRDVDNVAAGPGLGVSYTLDEFGKPTYHRERDYMIVVTMKSRRACPDATQGGTLFVFGPNGNRVPVRFVYPKP